MPTPTLLTAPLPALEQVLADAIATVKIDNPLAPVTVLIGGTLLRPYLQRRMAVLLGLPAIEGPGASYSRLALDASGVTDLNWRAG